jgi:hypothetical protein
MSFTRPAEAPQHWLPFVAALFGALLTGILLPSPGIPLENPPGMGQALWAIPGALIALALSYACGARREGR